MTNLHPKDVIAGLVLILIVILKLKGIASDFDTIAALILGYYFAKRANGQDKGN